ncbi:hypothetical protein D3C75_1097050 [compost metagenome]
MAVVTGRRAAAPFCKVYFGILIGAFCYSPAKPFNIFLRGSGMSRSSMKFSVTIQSKVSGVRMRRYKVYRQLLFLTETEKVLDPDPLP